ncbi:MAG TPA: alpha/beta hydrolase, partial [Roseiflexaceae bacterium]|nr:alpha/beta hydrolase [Roseiflexaceae bacterium]
YAQINGIRMHYVQAGHGERLVVLLHGFPEFWYSWRKQIPALAERFTVVAPDLRGYNETEKPRWGYELDVLVNDVGALIQELGFEKAVIVGHDWGGVIAWALAIAYPQWVERLIVLNAPHPAALSEAFGRNWRQMARSWYIGFFQLPWLPEWALSAGNYMGIEQMLRGAAVNPEIFSDEDIRRYKEAIGKPGALTAGLNYYRALIQGGTRGLFRGSGLRVNVPTLLIWGEHDIALGKELTYGLDRFVSNLQIVYLPNCSHWVQQECPEAVNHAMLAFLVNPV